jgi:calcineurin-like phosphoesterase family protein
MIWFTADEHYGHRNIIDFCNRPYKSLEEMNETLIANHNEVVKDEDIVIHAGDFCMWRTKRETVQKKFVMRLNGEHHVFLKGSHDYWLRGWEAPQIYEITQKRMHIVVCHYCMRVWARSHYNSWHLYGHSHGKLEPIGKSWDIGVDNNNYYPVSIDQVRMIMKDRPDNPNLIKNRRK